YGLGACIFIEKAVHKIFETKGRPKDNPLIAHLSTIQELSQIAVDIPKDCYLLAEAFWPGPLTIVLKRSRRVPEIVSAGLDSIAVRIPRCDIAKELISLAGEPLVAPSANLSGKPSSTHFQHVLHDFGGKIAAIVDGGWTELGIESTVISLKTPEHPIILRPGHVSLEDLERVLQKKVIQHLDAKTANHPVLSPGMKYRHYAPKAPLSLFTEWDAMQEQITKGSSKYRILVLSREAPPSSLASLDHLFLSSRELYAHLRRSDERGYEQILVYCDAKTLKDAALMNRLMHAANS
ncbi:MAG: L-threonylcarbamoyladenylate synthase, partial [Anaerolineae bacterium]